MNSTLSNVIMFAVGAAIGSAVTWAVVKSKYERIANEEIAEMRNYLRDNKVKKFEPEKFEPKKFEPKQSRLMDKAEYVNLTADYLRTFDEEEKGGAEDMDENKPYVIAPEDFGEKDDYDIVTFTHYADGVLEDDQCNIVEDPDEIVGEGYADHFGEFEEDSVYVRNDELKIDYEILLDVRTYADANSIGSHRSDE